jgi:heme-degrading monooxygenase HmoA
MYGTIARLQVRTEASEDVADLLAEYGDLGVPGFVASYLYRSDNDPQEHWLTVLFVDRESYRLNAADPEQDVRYRRLREYLVAEPEWHDGEIVAMTGTGATSGDAGSGF